MNRKRPNRYGYTCSKDRPKCEARRAKDLTLEHKVAKARIWAERRCGELLKGMKMAEGVLKRGTKLPRSSSATTATLKEMGLNKNQSSKYQQIFDVPENEFIDELAKLDRTSKTSAIRW